VSNSKLSAKEFDERQHCLQAAKDTAPWVEAYAERIELERAAARQPLMDAIRHFVRAFHEGDDDTVNDAIDKLSELAS